MLDSITPESRHSLLMVQDKNKQTPLHIASSSYYTDAVKYILDSITPESRHSLLMVQDENKQTPLHIASKSSSKDEIKCVYIRFYNTRK